MDPSPAPTLEPEAPLELVPLDSPEPIKVLDLTPARAPEEPSFDPRGHHWHHRINRHRNSRRKMQQASRKRNR